MTFNSFWDATRRARHVLFPTPYNIFQFLLGCYPGCAEQCWCVQGSFQFLLGCYARSLGNTILSLIYLSIPFGMLQKTGKVQVPVPQCFFQFLLGCYRVCGSGYLPPTKHSFNSFWDATPFNGTLSVGSVLPFNSF